MKKILFLAVLTAFSMLFANSYQIENFDFEQKIINSETVLLIENFGSVTNPGSSMLPFKTINIAVPADAKNISFSTSFSTQKINLDFPIKKSSAFSNGEKILTSESSYEIENHFKEIGLNQVGNLKFYQIGFYPFIEKDSYLELAKNINITLNYSYENDLVSVAKHNFEFAENIVINENELNEFYYPERPEYDYLIITSEFLYIAAEELISFREEQNLNLTFISTEDIQNQYQGDFFTDKIRNCVIDKYLEYSFKYLLLIGDIDVVPIKYLSPEPNFMNEVPSDFYYSDLTSNFDFDNDGLFGEYIEDNMDYTPEVYVGRIPLSDYNQVVEAVSRIVEYESSNESWKNDVLLPGGMLNYQYEGGEMEYERTDSADLFEQFKNDVLAEKNVTTLYEHSGVNPSVASDYDLTEENFQSLLNTNNYGFVNWSIHGSPISSSRRIWFEDSNSNQIPDSWEMGWEPLVNVNLINSLTNTNPSVFFCASCINGQIDYTDMSLGETLTNVKSAGNISATRNGWYKLGWRYSGFGGLTSYNYYFVDNFLNHKMPFSQAHAYTNFLHTEYFLFGDPVDAGGIVYPELQNVYTYTSYGDPAIGYQVEFTPELNGEILIWDMTENPKGLSLVNPIREMSGYNVVYIEDLLPNYPDISQAEAVFVLSGFGDNHQDFSSEEEAVLVEYLNQGGNLYLEGDVNWSLENLLYGMFDAFNVVDFPANIEYLQTTDTYDPMSWNYEGANDTMILTTNNATPILQNQSGSYIGIFNDNNIYKTIASSFEISEITERDNYQSELLNFIMNDLFAPQTSSEENSVSPEKLNVYNYPNPFNISGNSRSIGTNIFFNSAHENSKAEINIYNLKGQKVNSFKFENLEKGDHSVNWTGKDLNGNQVSSGIYFYKVKVNQNERTSKMLILK